MIPVNADDRWDQHRHAFPPNWRDLATSPPGELPTPSPYVDLEEYESIVSDHLPIVVEIGL